MRWSWLVGFCAQQSLRCFVDQNAVAFVFCTKIQRKPADDFRQLHCTNRNSADVISAGLQRKPTRFRAEKISVSFRIKSHRRAIYRLDQLFGQTPEIIAHNNTRNPSRSSIIMRNSPANTDSTIAIRLLLVSERDVVPTRENSTVYVSSGMSFTST